MSLAVATLEEDVAVETIYPISREHNKLRVRGLDEALTGKCGPSCCNDVGADRRLTLAFSCSCIKKKRAKRAIHSAAVRLQRFVSLQLEAALNSSKRLGYRHQMSGQSLRAATSNIHDSFLDVA